MYAIFELGGRQYRAEHDKTIKMDKLDAAVGATVSFDKVLLLHDGEKVAVGDPYIEGVKVTGRVIQQGRDRKLRVFKYKPKKRYKRMLGHRQEFTAVRIMQIEGTGNNQ